MTLNIRPASNAIVSREKKVSTRITVSRRSEHYLLERPHNANNNNYYIIDAVASHNNNNNNNYRQHAEIVKKRVVIEEAIDSAESELSPLSAENKHKLNSDVNCNWTAHNN